MLHIDKILRDENFLKFLRNKPTYNRYYNIATQKDLQVISYHIHLFYHLYEIYHLFLGGENMADVLIVNPTNGQTVKGGEKSKLVFSLSQTDIWTLAHNSKVIVRDKSGNQVFKASARFHDGSAEVEIVYPTKPGEYTIQVTVHNLLGSTTAITTGTFLVEDDKNQENFHMV